MTSKRRIITVGVAPAWDVVCRGPLDWGAHAQLDSQVVRPAGKALNVSRALAWMGRQSIATGLWGRDDYEQMLAAMRDADDRVQVRMTRAEGRTRLNVNAVDTVGGREMHLRARSELATQESVGALGDDLKHIVAKGGICVFSGAMPGGALLDRIVGLARACHEMGAMLAVDTHGPALKALVETGLAWLIAPNVEELSQLLGSNVPDTPAKLAAAGRSLLGKVETVLMSRGRKGAIVVTRTGAWACRYVGRSRAVATVGCGDYLLAGFLAGIAEKRPVRTALEQGIKTATARAWGWPGQKTWRQAQTAIQTKATALGN